MAVIFKKTKGLTDAQTHYCPGCTHGIIHRLVAEVLEEMDVLGTSIGVAPVGCSVLAYNYFNCDMHEAAHGRAPAVATGIKRVFPEHTVFTYQGDGDLASIGTAEIVHAANRGENITVIFVNNTTYGMTGGQMAPTTLIGEKATTCQGGRDPKLHGYPIRIAEMLSTLTGAVYVERVRVDTPGEVRKAKKAIRKAFDVQMAGLGFSIVEVLSTCPTNWGKTAPDALQWLRDNMVPYYPVQNFRNIDIEAAKEEK
ncbi:thiamine pyrophosphate-dependent enzyme [Peptostreptococcus canis]|uniref:2-oxoglutarate oxidoreductase n=1 Tax=Peptostreptococcus canis TaxID=1159213 RepID=A0ABR6TI65_9FIRM|nr:thiamine pyrophosphate-dependent enzyme [Peptostreptococcus canis]MBC2575082.1 2-oxoglutarate oxidoreductase [Peptostreptococcus canis]MBP1997744.1 2-oxoglutarate ferredoxin oxidoreductase subunit beta [Peptostreptococcus canis]